MQKEAMKGLPIKFNSSHSNSTSKKKKKHKTSRSMSEISTETIESDDFEESWLKQVPSEDFKLNTVAIVNPYVFIDETEECERDQIYTNNVKQSIENRRLWQSTKKHTKKVLLKKITKDAGPEWFQDLSFEQMDLVNDLQRRMLSDLERRSIDEVQEFFTKLGIIPFLDGDEVWDALKNSNGDPVRFLFSVQKCVSKREQDEYEKEFPFLEENNMPRPSFSVNERLILSAVFHYHFPIFIEQLDKLLPESPECAHHLWGKSKPNPKRTYPSPYLEPLPIKEMCWYEERAEKDLEIKVLKLMSKERGSLLVKGDKFQKFLQPLIDQGRQQAESYLEHLKLSKKKKRKKRKQELMKKSRESVMSKNSWEINCELESMMESEDQFFEQYSISDKELLEGNVAQKSKETIHSKKLSFVPPNLQFAKMFNKQTPKKMTMDDFNSFDEENIVEVLHPIMATPSEIEFYNDTTVDPTRISGSAITSQIVEGRLVETRSFGTQTLYTPDYGIIRNKGSDHSIHEIRIRRTLSAPVHFIDESDEYITHGYFDYTNPCPEQLNLKTLLKEIRYDMNYLTKISELQQQEDSLIPSVVVESLPLQGQESIDSDLLEIVGYEDPPPLLTKSQSFHSRMTIATMPLIPKEDEHYEECLLDKKPYNVECQDEECGIIDDPCTEVPMDEFTLARRKIAALCPEKQLKAAVDYLKERGDALGVLPDMDKVPWLMRWYEVRRGIMTKLTQEDKDKLMEDSTKIWDTPFFKITNIPIPELPMGKVLKWDRINEVKQKSAELHNKYQRKVRQQMVTNARNFFPSMKVEYFKSPLNQSFRRTFFAYEPSKEADCLTVKPWRQCETHNKDEGDCGRMANCKRQTMMNRM